MLPVTFIDIPQLLHEILTHAAHARASDIHVEARVDRFLIRLRIDGMLSNHISINYDQGIQLCSRIKVLAQLNVVDRRLPQDGSFGYKFLEHSFDIRVSTFPTLHGEKIALRLLDKSMTAHDLKDLGLSKNMISTIQSALQVGSGFILVTGPTGSGKTTTLHACINYIKNEQSNIVTLEDPIEYKVEGINQTQVTPEIGLTFEHGLRSLVRQDPDVILLGEMRDKETAQIAFQATLTGHLVLTTMHTADAPLALRRLVTMGIDSYVVSETLSLIIAQRLVRLLCNVCKKKQSITKDDSRYLYRYKFELNEAYYAIGCAHCQNTGYYGQTGIFQLMKITPRIRELFINNAHTSIIQQQALKDGMTTLIQDAFIKVQSGITSIAEIQRICS